MAQTLAIVVGAEIYDSHRQYGGLLSQGIVAESCVRPRRSATAAQPILLNDVRESGLRRLLPRRAADAGGPALSSCSVKGTKSGPNISQLCYLTIFRRCKYGEHTAALGSCVCRPEGK